MNDPIRIGLVEDQYLFREGMKAILSSVPDFEVVFESPDGYSVVERLDELTELPNVLLVDLSLPPDDAGNLFDGVAVTEAILKSYAGIRVIVLSVHDDERFMAELIERGAHGYLVKDSDPQEVIQAIRSVHDRGSYINQQVLLAIQNKLNGKAQKAKFANTADQLLTKREIEVLELVCEQLTAEQIAEKLFISVKTVNGHRNNLLSKTGSRNVAGLVLYAIKKNIVRVG